MLKASDQTIHILFDDNTATTSFSHPTAVPEEDAYCLVDAKIELQSTVVPISGSTEVWVTVLNMKEQHYVLNWTAARGKLSPALRTQSTKSIYTAPSQAVDDTIFLEIQLPGCAPIVSYRHVSVVESDEILEASPTSLITETPRDIVVAIDSSGSMVGDRFEAALFASEVLLMATAPDDRLALVAFANDSILVQPFTSEPLSLRSILPSDFVMASGGTDYGPALSLAHQELMENGRNGSQKQI
jgi:hypothetical protein